MTISNGLKTFVVTHLLDVKKSEKVIACTIDNRRRFLEKGVYFGVKVDNPLTKEDEESLMIVIEKQVYYLRITDYLEDMSEDIAELVRASDL